MMVMIGAAELYSAVCKIRNISRLNWCCKKTAKIGLRLVGTLVVPGSVHRSELLEPKSPKYNQAEHNLFAVLDSDTDQDPPDRVFNDQVS